MCLLTRKYLMDKVFIKYEAKISDGNMQLYGDTDLLDD